MTAIAACLSWSGNIRARDRVDRMLSAQSLFGPDNSALEGDDGLALGRNLLRMVPEDRFDRQPVAFGGGRYRLVADLRIDNRDELHRLLELPAAQARTMADSTVLASAFERWGIEKALSKLVGVFAIVVWDRQERELTLIRDPLGRRPLFYSRQSGFVAVAGMPKGLFALAEVPHEINETRLVEFISCLPHQGSSTLYKEVSRVEPGYLVRLSRDAEEARPWADLADLAETRFGSFEEALEALDEVMTVAVRSQLRSIGGVGSQLSGGLDSGVVTAMAARALADTGGTLHAFTAGPRDADTLPSSQRDIGNEVPQARRVAALFPNIRHHVVFNDCQPMAEVNARYISVMDETPLNPTNMPWVDGIFRRARQEGVTALLSGMAGNCTISAGLALTTPEFLHRRSTWSFFRRLAQLAAAGEIESRHAANYLLRAGLPRGLYLFIKERIARAAPPVSVTGTVFLQEAVLAEHDLKGRTDRRFRDSGFDSEIGRYLRLFLLLQLDLGTVLKAAHALEQVDYRDPTSDLRVVKFCLSAPIEMFTANGSDRAFGKAMYRRHVSEQALYSFIRGRQAADCAGLFLGERQTITQEITRATADNPLFRRTDPSSFLQSLERLNESEGTAREQSVTWQGLIRYSRLLGVSQFLNAFDGRNGP